MDQDLEEEMDNLKLELYKLQHDLRSVRNHVTFLVLEKKNQKEIADKQLQILDDAKGVTGQIRKYWYALVSVIIALSSLVAGGIAYIVEVLTIE